MSMSQPRLIRTTTAAVVAILSTLLTSTAASATSADTTPPTAPLIGYAEGFYCLTVIIGANRSADDVTPQSQLRYEAFADGALIGSLTDQGDESGVWGVLQLKKAGPSTVTVQAIDAAGNRSALSNADVVTGYYTPGCTPYHF
jgi:hypothetical protein